jgi:hypothetical protein
MTALILSAAWLGGCANAVPVVDFYDADSDTLARFGTIATVSSHEGYLEIGKIQGIHCPRHWQSAGSSSLGSREIAIDQLKLKAAEMQADAITEPACVSNRELDSSNTCVGVLMCEATALRHKEN